MMYDKKCIASMISFDFWRRKKASSQFRLIEILQPHHVCKISHHEETTKSSNQKKITWIISADLNKFTFSFPSNTVTKVRLLIFRILEIQNVHKRNWKRGVNFIQSCWLFLVWTYVCYIVTVNIYIYIISSYMCVNIYYTTKEWPTEQIHVVHHFQENL